MVNLTYHCDGKECKLCGKKFPTDKWHFSIQQYCSPKCRHKAYRIRFRNKLLKYGMSYSRTKKHIEAKRIYDNKRNIEKRKELFELIGGIKCVCPGIDCWHEGFCLVIDFRCIQIEHIRGTKHKNEEKNLHSGHYKYYLEYSEEAKRELQPYCANCNWTKRDRNKEIGVHRKYE